MLGKCGHETCFVLNMGVRKEYIGAERNDT